MASWRAKALSGLGALSAAGLAAIPVGRRRQERALAAQLDRMTTSARQAVHLLPGPRRAGILPSPVERYLRWALPDDRQMRLFRIRQVGSLRADVRSARWMTFEAEHTVAPEITAFLWDARVKVAPLLYIRVRDSLFEGNGAGQVAVFSAVTVAADGATPEMNSGSLHRFLAEAPWYPNALLPTETLRWDAIDEHSAMATLADRHTTVSLEFRFGENGQITGMFTPGRWGKFAGGYRQAPWEGRFRNYEKRAGLFVPTAGEVGWHAGGVYQPVWRGRVVDFEVEGSAI